MEKKEHPGALNHPTPDNTLYIDASKLDFGNITTSDFKNGIGEDSRIQTLNAGNFVRGLKKGRLQNTVYALGRVNLILLNGAGDVKVVNNEATDYDWNKGGGFIRNTLIMGNKIGSIWKNGIYTSILIHQTEKILSRNIE